jgi:hypothetical protein
MTGFNHGMTGAVIALSVKQPLLAVPLAFLSHFATDLLPHFGVEKEAILKREFNIILVLDFLFAVFLMIILAILFPDQILLIWACMIAAAAPDLMWAYHRLYIAHYKKRPMRFGTVARFHQKIQWSQTMPGIFIEAGWFILMGLIILHLLI